MVINGLKLIFNSDSDLEDFANSRKLEENHRLTFKENDDDCLSPTSTLIWKMQVYTGAFILKGQGPTARDEPPL